MQTTHDYYYLVSYRHLHFGCFVLDARDEIRKALRQKRAGLTAQDQAWSSRCVTERLVHDACFQRSHHIAVYTSVDYEIDTKDIVQRVWESSKQCYLPIVRANVLVFGAYEKITELKNNVFNIPEPFGASTRILHPRDIDLVLVPVLAFSKKCHRLGRGAGFYDRSFHFLLMEPRPAKPFLVGLAYEWQGLEAFEVRPWDVPMNAIMTDKTSYLYTPDA